MCWIGMGRLGIIYSKNLKTRIWAKLDTGVVYVLIKILIVKGILMCHHSPILTLHIEDSKKR